MEAVAVREKTLCQMFDFNINTVRRWRRNRLIPYHKTNGSIRYVLQEIKDWLDLRKVVPNPP